ncbi:MAG TPA: M48 family metalloprotease [Paracoccaceae bacterium]|nr:M48 family metalloprotease [Paracoccaceae bacterium]
MIRFLPVLLAIGLALVMYRFSAWRTSKVLDQKSARMQDPALDKLTAEMAKALDIPRIKVRIYEIAPINGLAAPDGRIFITRGFFNKYKAGEVSAEEMASVIAHELGHVALGHSRRRMIDFAGQNAIRLVLMTVIGRIIPFVGAYLVNFLISLLAARLSRQDEYEADAYAAALLTKVGIGVEPQVRLLQKLEFLTGSTGSPVAWLMSHPKASERVAAIRKLEAGWG